MILVPIKPYQTQVLNIAIGQRYDVIVTANQGAIASDFWIRSIPKLPVPRTQIPIISKQPSFPLVPQQLYLCNRLGDPTLLMVQKGVNTFTTANNLIELPKANEWVYLIIHSNLPVPHPIHLHGHDFFVVSQQASTYDAKTAVSTYNLNNPPRRDVALLPSGGYLVLAFETDNPVLGWLIVISGWHTSEGFAMQFLERASEIPAILDSSALENTCIKWNSNAIHQEDSGV
ncbi:hypothetical protein DID88_000027 [Monilinia fructigena]|uniref:Plastocyanin-like domain-containing protein n=1 Tax=Monilinia fructigena TaxID=38457 RepID=A0A395IIW8_9HELO|nr:hypothetical protein DID88_000027 [Monilinia fructigena]